jgi:hypothetical protein
MKRLRQPKKGLAERYIPFIELIDVLVKTKTPFVITHVAKHCLKHNSNHIVTILRALLYKVDKDKDRGRITYAWKKDYKNTNEIFEGFLKLSSEGAVARKLATKEYPTETNIMLGLF